MILENLNNRCGANVNIAIVLAKQLSKSFEVHALVRYDEVKPISCEKKETFGKVHTFYADQTGKLAKFTSDDWSEVSRLEKIMRFCKSPSTFISMVDAKYFDFSITKRKCKKAIEEVCSKQEYDVVIGVSAPYYIMQAVAEANVNCRKMAIQLDPFTNNYTLSSRFKKRRKKIENRTYSKLSVLFAGDYLYDDLLAIISKARENIIPTPLPGLVCESMVDKTRTFENDGQAVNFLFVGQFYENIRNPHYLLELFSYLPSNYYLHIVGGGCEKEVEKYISILGERLIRHGWVSKEEANAFMDQFDVLVNVNNTITNQLPSKLFEYIATGKPIVNLCKSDVCLSQAYMDKYENGICIVEEKGFIDCNAKLIENFVEQNLHIVLSKDEILNRFNENTDVSVAKCMLDKILLCAMEVE